MCYATKDEVKERVWSLSPCPRPPNQRRSASSATQSPGLRPTPLSIAGVPEEVSHQRVACFFPVASHSWLGAAGLRGRQGARPCRGTPTVSATIHLGRSCSSCAP